jgi:hypothetical protein
MAGRATWRARLLPESPEDRRGEPREKASIPTMAIVHRRDAVGPVRLPSRTPARTRPRARRHGPRRTPRHDPASSSRTGTSGLTGLVLEKQVACGRTIYETRRAYDRPGKSLVRFPALLFSFRISDHGADAARRPRRQSGSPLPWLLAGEVARIQGFLQARRARLRAAPRQARAA